MIRLLEGDCRIRLRELADDSIDACVTDPPYHLTTGKKGGSGPASVNLDSPHGRSRVTTGFMGMKWDGGDVAFQVDMWREVFRVLKPGAHVLAFGGTRTYHRMACAIEDAGFEVRDMGAWLYGSGFPKSLDISKAIDKAGPQDQAPFAEFAAHYEERRKSRGLTHAQICAHGHFHGEVNHGGASVNWARGYGMPTSEQWPVLRDLLGLEDRWEERVKRIEYEREVIGQREATRLAVAPGADNDRGATVLDVTAHGSADAAQWQGWGTALKPALEPIFIGRKPFRGTVAANVLKHGTGALNIDACRIAGSKPDTVRGAGHVKNGRHAPIAAQGAVLDDGRGRWPANVMHDGSEEVVSAFPAEAGGGHWPGARGRGNISTDGHGGQADLEERFADGGSAARFFYSPKASRSDRNVGCDDLPFQSEGTDRSAKNFHPTVKPTDLMRWLVRLVTPPGGTVLDPFAGSGSTGRAADIEQFNAILIELDPAYCEIIRRRVAGDMPLFAAGAVQP